MKNSKYIVADAKWKILEKKESNKISISSNDVYQIFAYLNFYDCKETAILFVPQAEIEYETTLCYQFNKNTTDKKIKIIPINLNEIILNQHKIEILF